MTVYVPSDAARTVADWLKTELAAAFPTLTIGLELPSSWSKTSPPALVVFDDAGPIRAGEWPVATRPLLRVTVWAGGRSEARTVAGRALGLLLCKPVPGVARVKPATQLLDTRDSNTGGYVASFTVNTTARTVAL